MYNTMTPLPCKEHRLQCVTHTLNVITYSDDLNSIFVLLFMKESDTLIFKLKGYTFWKLKNEK